MDNRRRRFCPTLNPQGNHVASKAEERPPKGVRGAHFGTVPEEALHHFRDEMKEFPGLQALANDMGIDFDNY